VGSELILKDAAKSRKPESISDLGSPFCRAGERSKKTTHGLTWVLMDLAEEEGFDSSLISFAFHTGKPIEESPVFTRVEIVSERPSNPAT